ncbi:MAG: GAF domain-containing protein [Gemmatimonadaceae bacterium]|nr:GAF domain-containing protein [Gemmatimonadaceae bacterium]
MSNLTGSLERFALPVLLVEPESSIIVEMNTAAATLCGSRAAGRRLVDFLGLPSQATRALLSAGMSVGLCEKPVQWTIVGGAPRDVVIDAWAWPESRRPLLLVVVRDVSQRVLLVQTLERTQRLLDFCTKASALATAQPRVSDPFDAICRLAVTTGIAVGARITHVAANGLTQSVSAAGHVSRTGVDGAVLGVQEIPFAGATGARGELQLFHLKQQLPIADEPLLAHLVGLLASELDAHVRAEGPEPPAPAATVQADEGRLGVFEFRMERGEGTCNEDFALMLGYDPSTFELTYTWWQSHIHPDDLPRVLEHRQAMLHGELRQLHTEFRMRTADGQYRWLRAAVHATDPDSRGHPRRLIGTHTDITTQRTTEHAAARRGRGAHATLEMPALAESLEPMAFLQAGLDIAERLTDSRIGFLHFVKGPQQDIELVTWSTATLQSYCTMSEGSRHYPLAKAGIWADACRTRRAIIVNDYAGHIGRTSLPEGHAFLDRFTVVPVIERGAVVMLIGVGNKKVDYDEVDTMSLQILADEIWRLYRWRQDEAALRKASQFHQVLLESLESAVFTCDRDGQVTMHNRVAREWLGVPVDARAPISSADLVPLLHTADGARPLRAEEMPLLRLLAGAEVRGEELRLRVPDRPDRLCRCVGRRWADKTGQSLGALLVMQEVSA